MDELGQILKEAREAKGLTLTQVQDQTRINQRFLDAMERGDYTTLPTPVHVRGFLRNYARFLNLDPAPLLERYERIKPGEWPGQAPAPRAETPLPAAPLPVRDDQPFFDPVNYELNPTRQTNTESRIRLLIILALLVCLGLVATRFVPLLTGQGDGTDALTASINEVWQDITAQEPAATDLTAAATPLSLTPEPILSTSRNDLGQSTGAAAPTPFPTRPPLPATLEVIDLTLTISERTWLEVTVDGDVRFSGWAKRGDVYEWTAEDEVTLLTGNAFGVIATINEVELGRLGGFQEAREEIWRTTQ
ncbi:MAG: helix-turn-helix domain-containing protein [Anaerolineales bacterium]|nr:helix-turn-helix domain-containing protein [Anaerolineales bacterium]